MSSRTFLLPQSGGASVLFGIKVLSGGAVVSLLLRYHGINEPVVHYLLGLASAAVMLIVVRRPERKEQAFDFEK